MRMPITVVAKMQPFSLLARRLSWCAVFCIALCAESARAEEYGYYIAPQQIRSSFQIGYSVNAINHNDPVTTPVGQFGNTFGGFRFDPDTKTMVGLRLTINAGTLTTPDKSFTWKLLGPDMFDINNYDEIILEYGLPVIFKDGLAEFEAKLWVHGFAKPLVVSAKINYIKDSAIGMGFLGKNKTIGMTLRGTFKEEEYNMKAFDDIGRSLGDRISLILEMQGVRQ
jgi:polyisoprenoid-binding protein YceI